MKDILTSSTVLVLNRSWQAINTRAVKDALIQMSTDVACGLDITGDDMRPVPWDEWITLPIRDGDGVIHTKHLKIRVPTVIVLASYNKVPKKRPQFSPKAVWDRDKGTCQYTGRKLAREEANVDHIQPVSRGGETSWENCVISDRRINTKKADKTPQEAGLRLLRAPVAPKELPVTMFIKNTHGISDWDRFLMIQSA